MKLVRAFILTIIIAVLLILSSPVTTVQSSTERGGYSCPYDIDYVREELDYARELHQRVVDNPNLGVDWQTTTQKLLWNYRWVKTYEEAIDILNWIEE